LRTLAASTRNFYFSFPFIDDKRPIIRTFPSETHMISQGYYYHTTVADQRVSQLNLSSPRNIPIRSGYQVAQRRTTAIFAWKIFKN
jgi:hypothetical protein